MQWLQCDASPGALFSHRFPHRIPHCLQLHLQEGKQETQEKKNEQMKWRGMKATNFVLVAKVDKKQVK